MEGAVRNMTMKDIRVVVDSILVVVFYACSSTGDNVQESGSRGSKPCEKQKSQNDPPGD
jgi:hypothetical protein